MTTRKPMGEILYSLLPDLYKKEDAERTHLKRFLQVNGTGLDFLRSKTDGHTNMFDLDKTPPELLPHIAKMMGFDFPYDMTVQEQRSMLKVLPLLNKMKGTATSFNYLAQNIFGVEAKAFSEWVSRGGLNGENQIKINVEADGELSYLQTRIDRYYKYSEQFRPINHKLFWKIMLYYSDVYNRQNKVFADYSVPDFITLDDDYDPNLMPRLNNGLILNNGTVFPTLKGDLYDRAKISAFYDKDILLVKEDDSYVFDPVDEIFKEVITVLAETDSYDRTKIAETITELVKYDDNLVINDSTYFNKWILNSSTKFSGLTIEGYDKTKISEMSSDVLLDSSEEIYNKGIAYDEELTSTIKYADSDTYSKVKDDTITSKTVDLANSLNVALLNSTMLLSKNPTVTTLNY